MKTHANTLIYTLLFYKNQFLQIYLLINKFHQISLLFQIKNLPAIHHEIARQNNSIGIFLSDYLYLILEMRDNHTDKACSILQCIKSKFAIRAVNYRLTVHPTATT